MPILATLKGVRMKVDIFNTDKKYNVIYCDPAWQFSNKKTGGSMSSSAQDQYRVTSLDEMKALPVESLADEDCALITWWVGSMPQEAIDLCKAWGFKLQNMNGFVWRKLTVKGLPFFGMGFTTRAGSESCIVAYRGKQSNLVKNRGVRAVIEAKVGKHSEKPQEFRDAIKTIYGSDVPMIELFSRKEIYGWDRWGDQA
jgi:N6-adenosine-specific RNA methylase IME4